MSSVYCGSSYNNVALLLVFNFSVTVITELISISSSVDWKLFPGFWTSREWPRSSPEKQLMLSKLQLKESVFLFPLPDHLSALG